MINIYSVMLRLLLDNWSTMQKLIRLIEMYEKIMIKLQLNQSIQKENVRVDILS